MFLETNQVPVYYEYFKRKYTVMEYNAVSDGIWKSSPRVSRLWFAPVIVTLGKSETYKETIKFLKTIVLGAKMGDPF